MKKISFFLFSNELINKLLQCFLSKCIYTFKLVTNQVRLLVIVWLLFTITAYSQSVGISTDGSAPESGLMLDVKGSNTKATTALQNILQLKSLDTDNNALKLRFGLQTHLTATSRYGLLEVPDFTSGVPSYRALVLQPNGGNVGIGTTSPGQKMEIEIPLTTGTAVPLVVQNPLTGAQDGGGSGVGIGFMADWMKGVLFYERQSSFGRGDFHFLQNTAANNTGATLSDAVMTINNAGNVGIGTTTPLASVHIAKSNAGELILEDAGQAAATLGRIWMVTSNNLDFGLDTYDDDKSIGLRVLTAKASGNVGIGTTNPQAKLDIGGSGQYIRFTGTAGGGGEGVQYLDASSTYRYGLIFPGSDVVALSSRAANGTVEIRANTATAGSLGEKISVVVEDDEVQLLPSGGNVGIGTTTPGGQLELSLDQGRKPGTNTWTIVSDTRLKNIEGAYTKGLQEVLQLQPITYHYKNVGTRKFKEEVLKTLHVGFSAQQVQQVFPEAIGTDDDGYLNFNMHAILVAYANAFKEQQKIMESQQSVIDNLKAENTAIKQELIEIKSFIGLQERTQK